MYRIYLPIILTFLVISSAAHAFIIERKQAYTEDIAGQITYSSSVQPMDYFIPEAKQDLDVYVDSSYGGTGQTWSNYIADTNYDLFLGTTSGAESADPTYVSAGGLRYFETDGVDDQFVLSTSMAVNTVIADLYKDTSTNFYMYAVIKPYLPAVSPNDDATMWAVYGSSNRQMKWFLDEGKYMYFRHQYRSGSSRIHAGDSEVFFGTRVCILLTSDQAAGISDFYINSYENVQRKNTAYLHGTGDFDPNSNTYGYDDGGEGDFLPDGWQVESYGFGTKYVDAVDVGTIFDQLNYRDPGRNCNDVANYDEANSTAGYASTATYNAAKTYDVTVDFPNHGGVGLDFCKNIGSEVTWADNHDGMIYVASLSTDFDPSTKTLQPSKYFNTGLTNISDVTYVNGGQAMVVTEWDTQDFFYYDLSTDCDPSTAVEDVAKKFDATGTLTEVRDVEFSDDGMRMFVADSGDNDLNVYDLSAAFNMSTAVINAAQELDLSSIFSGGGAEFRAMDFADNGLDLLVAGPGTEYVRTVLFDVAYDTRNADIQPETGSIFVEGDGMAAYGLYADDAQQIVVTTSAASDNMAVHD